MKIKAWAVVGPDREIIGVYETVPKTVGGETVVELTGELLHEWKVGDWAMNEYGTAVQILMLNLGAAVFWYFDEGVWSAVVDIDILNTWTPCEAPEWFSEDLGPGDLDMLPEDQDSESSVNYCPGQHLSWKVIQRRNG